MWVRRVAMWSDISHQRQGVVSMQEGGRETGGGGNTKGVTLALGHWADACRPVAFWQLPLREVESGGG